MILCPEYSSRLQEFLGPDIMSLGLVVFYVFVLHKFASWDHVDF